MQVDIARLTKAKRKFLMDKKQSISTFEYIKSLVFFLACVAFIIPFVGYCSGKYYTKTPSDPLPLVFCFALTVLFDALQKRNVRFVSSQRKIDRVINDFEITIGLLVIPMMMFFNGIDHNDAVSLTAIICSIIFFGLKLIYLTQFSSMRKGEN